MIDRTHELPLTQQCRILGVARSSLYYTPRAVSALDLALMRRIDELHLEHPFAGTRMLRDLLRGEGYAIGRKHVGTLMRRMGIEALYRKPNTSRRKRGDEIYPYLLRDLKIERPNQVWAADITYIPMRKGFVYLFAVMDWSSRRVLAWRLSNTLTTDFCLDAVREALYRYGVRTSISATTTAWRGWTCWGGSASASTGAAMRIARWTTTITSWWRRRRPIWQRACAS